MVVDTDNEKLETPSTPMMIKIPSLHVVDPETGDFVTTVVKGSTYHIQAQDFNEGAKVTLRIITQGGLPFPIPGIASFQPPLQKLNWTVSQLLLSDQYVYFKGQQDNDENIPIYSPEVYVDSATSSFFDSSSGSSTSYTSSSFGGSSFQSGSTTTTNDDASDKFYQQAMARFNDMVKNKGVINNRQRQRRTSYHRTKARTRS